MKELYKKWIPEDKIILVDSNTSELSKIVSNAFLAQRISSINSISNLCEISESDINQLSKTVGSDSRIGKNFLKASMGFGGSCLKKDVLSLVYILNSRSLGLEAQYWSNVVLMNEYQRLRIANLILNCYEKLKQKRSLLGTSSDKNDYKINIFGLSFKSNTNDVRSSNTIFLANFLLKHKVKLNLFDPHVNKKDFINELKIFNENLPENLLLADSLSFYTQKEYYIHIETALGLSQINVFCNDHKEFQAIKMINRKNSSNKEATIFDEEDNRDNSSTEKIIFDLFDVFDLDTLKEAKFCVYKLGVVNEIQDI